MTFGPVIQFKASDLSIELAPIPKESARMHVDIDHASHGLNQHSVTQYLPASRAYTDEDEQEWWEKVRGDSTRIVWGIWVLHPDGTRELIGNSTLFDIQNGVVRQAESGSMLFNKKYWGKGIARAAHKVRTSYAFRELGLHRITSGVMVGNEASKRALVSSGYVLRATDRNVRYVHGKLIHAEYFECINPIDAFWSVWWGDDTPTDEYLAARTRTEDVLDWVQKNAELL